MLRTAFYTMLALCCFRLAYAGGASDSGGGDSYVIDFIATGERVSQWLSVQKINDISGLSAEKFESTLKSAKITSTEAPLLLDEVEKDAINYPSEGKIVLNRSRWNFIDADFRKVGIVIHELLGLMKIDDQGYKVSIVLSSKITGVNPKNVPFFKVNYTCESYAFAQKDKGSNLVDSQKVLTGYNPSFTGMQGVIHHIDGKIYYMAVDIMAEMDSANPNDKNWKVDYHWLSEPLNPNFKILGTSSFYAIGSELPPKFSLPFYQSLKPDDQTTISFRLTCKQN